MEGATRLIERRQELLQQQGTLSKLPRGGVEKLTLRHWLVGRAFGQTLSLPVLVAGTGLAGAFTRVSPAPLGVGMVEGALAAILSTLGVHLEAAAAISLAYRGLTLWLPMVSGFAALQWGGLRWAR